MYLVTDIDPFSGPGSAWPRLAPLLLKLDRSKLDLILVEGFRHQRLPKIELHRRAQGKPFLHRQDSSIIAFASDKPCAGTALPALDLNQPRQILGFILNFIASAQTGTLE